MSFVEDQARRAREASILLRRATAGSKSAALKAMGARLKSRLPDILEANKADLDQAKAEKLSDAKLDRLKLDEKRVDEIAKALTDIGDQPDPVNRVYDERKAPSGVTCKRVRVPIGVILMIFESRPNVTAEAAALCLRAGNAVLLKGGHEAARTNRMIATCLQGAVAQEGLPTDAVQLVEGGHEAIDELLLLDRWIDVVIPRGGEGLIRSVVEKARMPVIKHYKGNCHVYVDEAADPIMARTIVLNAKTQRPATCNAAEKLLIHERVAEKLLPQIAERLIKAGVKLRGDDAARRLIKDMKVATEQDWSEEYLDLIMSVKVVRDLDEAIRQMTQTITKDYEMLKNFADNASHEMQTPVAIINSKLDLLIQDTALSMEHHRPIQAMYDAVGRLRQLNQSLLLLTKIENNQFVSETVDLAPLIERKLVQLEDPVKDRRLTVHTELDALQLPINGYLADILLNNLLTNAIRHNQDGGQVNIRLRGRGLRVSNSGAALGFDASTIFDRFTKGMHSGGTGLGLAIVRQICDNYHFGLTYSYAGEMHTIDITFN